MKFKITSPFGQDIVSCITVGDLIRAVDLVMHEHELSRNQVNVEEIW